MTEQTMTREQWLNAAVEVFRPRFVEIGLPLPEKVHVSVGFPDGFGAESKYVMAVCFCRDASTGGINEIFVSPEYDNTTTVLGVLIHELIHAADDNKSGHKGAFAEAATRLGLTGKMTATVPGVALEAELITIAETLGEYPHVRTRLFELLAEVKANPVPAGERKVPVGSSPVGTLPRVTSGRRPQATYMRKLVCPTGDGFSVRTTAKMLAMGMPSCPCGHVMEEA